MLATQNEILLEGKTNVHCVLCIIYIVQYTEE